MTIGKLPRFPKRQNQRDESKSIDRRFRPNGLLLHGINWNKIAKNFGSWVTPRAPATLL
jgi:hypothetical protein